MSGNSEFLTISDNSTASPEDMPLGQADAKTPDLQAALITDRFIRGMQATYAQSRQYWLNRSYLTGQQWLYWDNYQDRVVSLPRVNERVRASINTLWAYSRILISKIIQRELDWDVPPSDGDDASMKGAQLGEAILRHTARTRNWENLREQLAWCTLLGGTAALSLDWDAKAGQPLSMGGAKLGIDPETNKHIGTGEIVETVLSVSEICTEPGIRDLEHARWWIRAVALPPKDVRTMYDLPEIPAADATSYMSPYEGRISTLDKGNVRFPLTLVLTYYERPNPSRPDGAVCTVVNDKVVAGPDKWPFPFKDRLNLVLFRETKHHDRWWADTVFSAAIPIQTAYNASWSSIIEHMKLAGNARLMVPQSLFDSYDQINDSPDSVIPYDAEEGKAEYLSPPVMPSWWVQQPEMLDATMQTILGVHDVTKGTAPPNIESGVGLSILGEADDTPLAMMVKDVSEGWSRYGTMVLQVYEDKVKESRKVRMNRGSSHSATPSVNSWTGKKLNGQTLAHVPLEAIVPRSRAAMQALATALWDRHIITDPKQYARIADLPSRDNFTEGLDPDMDKAERENSDMAEGQAVIPASFDDHQTHIKFHNQFRKMERYERMSAKDASLVDMHVQAHANMAAEAMGMQSQRMNVNPNLAASPNANETPPLAHPNPPPAAIPSAPTQGERQAATQIHGMHHQDTQAVLQAIMEAQAAQAAQGGVPANLVTPTAHPFGTARLPQGADDMEDRLKQTAGLGPTI